MTKTQKRLFGLAFLPIFMIITIILAIFVNRHFNPPSEVKAITREGVITQIQGLNRLTTVAFGVDTVITASKEGTWYKLWQDGQKGLFVANGRVLAGVDLAKITPEQVRVDYPTNPKNPNEKINIAIELPTAQIFEVYLDNIQVYDWQTGLFGIVDNDPEILNTAQTAGKTEVLNKACKGDVLKIASDNAKSQVAGLFGLMGDKVAVTVTMNGVGECKLS